VDRLLAQLEARHEIQKPILIHAILDAGKVFGPVAERAGLEEFLRPVQRIADPQSGCKTFIGPRPQARGLLQPEKVGAQGTRKTNPIHHFV
jgi:hypothetical protein